MASGTSRTLFCKSRKCFALSCLLKSVFRFRLGKMYRYNLEKYDPDSLLSFMNGFYKNLPAEKIPLPKTPL